MGRGRQISTTGVYRPRGLIWAVCFPTSTSDMALSASVRDRPDTPALAIGQPASSRQRRLIAGSGGTLHPIACLPLRR
jgi:hypothetical protein